MALDRWTSWHKSGPVALGGGSGRRGSERLLALILWACACAVACAPAAGGGGGGFYDASGPAPVFGGEVVAAADSGGAAKDSASGEDATLADVVLIGEDAASEIGPVTDAIVDTADAKADAKADAAGDAKTDAKADAKGDVGTDTVDTAGAACGDGSCDGGETCTSCPDDCGVCPPVCGDKQCDSAETCQSCPGDCGPCAPACGNKKCESPTENCQNCATDCGKCPVLCGDGTCDATETCSSCAADCCAPKCGNGVCDQPTEDCKTCPSDCGMCPGTACNPITSQGCKATEQCYLGNDLKPVCAAPGSIQKGAACTGLADCVKGYICVSGQCGKACDTKNLTPGYSCPNGGICDVLSINGTPLPYNLGVCFGGESCNTVTNDLCPAGQSCIFASNTKACVIGGKGGSGAVCKNYGDCLPTHICVNDSATGGATCVQKCNALGLTPKCLSPKTCQGLAAGNPPKAAPDNLGGCF